MQFRETFVELLTTNETFITIYTVVTMNYKE